jgi:hypothetical protein
VSVVLSEPLLIPVTLAGPTRMDVEAAQRPTVSTTRYFSCNAPGFHFQFVTHSHFCLVLVL